MFLIGEWGDCCCSGHQIVSGDIFLSEICIKMGGGGR